MRLAVAVLQDTTKVGSWNNIAWYLGELGFPEGFEPLRDFVWATHGHSDTSRSMMDAITSAQAAIGNVARSNPAALGHLIQSANPSFWKSLPWRDPRMSAEELRFEMALASIKGLGLSGKPEAGQMLRRLRQWPYAEAQRSAIEDAFRRFRYVTLMRQYDPEDLQRRPLFHLPELLPESADSSLLYGTWRWVRSSYSSGYYAPPACDWSRTLELGPDSIYSFWEEDSAGVYRICSGRFTIHRTPQGRWIELEGWLGDDSKIYWPKIMGSDLLALRPGGSSGVWRGHLGASLMFSRERVTPSPTDRRNSTTWRPPRIRRWSRTSFSIEVPRPLGPIPAESQRWSSYTGLGPKDYEYTHYQIPSGVIGDFDGDTMADAAILGYGDDYKNGITCLLSNRGAPRAVVVWIERGSGTKDGPTRPLHYLKLYPSGRSYVDSRGKRSVLATDAIWVVGKEGASSILSYGDGLFRQTTLERSNRGRY